MKKPAKLVWIILILISVFAAVGSAETAVDLDLSACNRSITYAQVVQVCNAPEGYDGKVFRLTGKFNYSEKLDTARIIFSDSAGCCELALPFAPAEALSYPEDYPPLYSNITITARLAADPSDPELSCQFVDAVVEWKNEDV